MTYRILGKRILVRPVDTEERMAGFPSIIIPEAVRQGYTANQAEVVAVGTQCDTGLREGDWVLLRSWSRSEAPASLGPEMFLVAEDAVLAKVTP